MNADRRFTTLQKVLSYTHLFEFRSFELYLIPQHCRVGNGGQATIRTTGGIQTKYNVLAYREICHFYLYSFTKNTILLRNKFKVTNK